MPTRLVLLLLILAWPAVALGYVAHDRWTQTATNTDTGGNGTPITLTWSIVPDSTIVPGRGPSDLVSWLDAEFGSGPGGIDFEQRPWFSFFSDAFARWDSLSGTRFVYYPVDDGVALGNFAGETMFRGDVRVGGASIDGPGGTLAYSGLVGEADIVIDTSDSDGLLAPAGDFRKFRNVLLHEIGHSLGLVHLTSPNSVLLMEPSIDLTISGPQLDDIRGVQRMYGDAHESPTRNNALGTATPLGNLVTNGPLRIGSDAGLTQTVAPTAIDFVSISGSGDQDWYSFVIDQPTSIDIALTPLGGSFTQTPEGGSTMIVNATAANNLGFSVHGPNTFGLRGSSLAAPAGALELLTNLSLPEAGTYFVQVVGFNDAVQFYDLTVTRLAMLAGDYNGDGFVDAADFTVWRETESMTGPGLAADGNGDQVVDMADYGVWRTAFGTSSSAHSAANESASADNVPEPASIWVVLLLGSILVGRQQLRS